MHRIISILWFVFYLSGLLGAQIQYRFEHSSVIDKEKGLPTNNVRGICKDENGFMWFATTDGLCRFDGAHIKVYRNDPADSTTLFDNQVLCIAAYQGRIWAGTGMGLSILDPRTEKFVNIQFDSSRIINQVRRIPYQGVMSFFADPWGDLWIGTVDEGAIRYRAQQHDFQFFTPADTVPYSFFNMANQAERVVSFAASPRYDSLVYAGTPAGLLEMNRYTGTVKSYVFAQATPKLQVSANAFLQVYIHDNGLMYTGNWYAGMHVFDPVGKTYLPLPLKEGPGNDIINGVSVNISRKSAEEIWVTTGSGLAIYNSARHKVTFFKRNDIDAGRYYGLDLIDKEQRVWFSHITGVHIFDPCLQQLVTYDYAKLHPPGWSYTYHIEAGPTDDELVILPRNDGGIYHFNLKSRTFKRFPLECPGVIMPAIWPVHGGISRAPDGSYTISTDLGMFSYSAATHQLHPLAYKPPIEYYDIAKINWDRQGRLWMSCARKGMYRWDPHTGMTRHYKTAFSEKGLKNPDPTIFFITGDSRGQGWIRREDGFSVYLPDRDTIINFISQLHPDQTFVVTTSFAEDKHGRMWIAGTDGNLGYAEMDHPEYGIVKKFDLRKELGLTEIYQITTDRHGNVWGYTLKELLFIDTDSLKFHTLSMEYGISDPDFYDLKFAANGELFIGGRNKIFSFDPRRMQRNAESPLPYVEEIQVQGKPLPAIPTRDGLPALHLQYWENYFSVAFSAIAYTLGNKCRFRYRLAGFEDWQEAADRRYANYTNVPGGDYVFQIQVANNEGVWSRHVLEMPVQINTAWYATWWFRLGLFALAVSLIYGTYRYRIVQIRREERLRTAFEKRLANVEMSALLAQMNPHFLFNSLNSIDSYIIRNESKKASEYLNNFARLMRLILNNSRSNYISLKDELESLDLYLQMESLRFKDKFEYEIRVDDHLDTSSINIPPMLIQPYVENAIWHGLMHKDDGTGKVTIRIKEQEEILTCTVEDNGVGRARARELTPNRTGKNRQSMGMQITKDRIDIINKLYDANTRVQIIDLHDDAGTPHGTRVVLTIPI